ncbi:MAG: hypothetical protein COB37_10480 [Kordiimonadales bacterium]|nr:MAG: hypothetical protein COB37_10480 [Kordiimonadales bacterium]
MAELKTKENARSVDDFISAVEHEKRREDARVMKTMMERITGYSATMWGSSIVGFGAYDYTYDSGHSGRSHRTGFSPRKAALTIYIMAGFSEYGDLMAKLGKYKSSVSCLYIKKLEDVDLAVLEEIITRSLAFMNDTYPEGD